jgi:soluble lytic murein transglycosylase-like protein
MSVRYLSDFKNVQAKVIDRSLGEALKKYSYPNDLNFNNNLLARFNQDKLNDLNGELLSSKKTTSSNLLENLKEPTVKRLNYQNEIKYPLNNKVKKSESFNLENSLLGPEVEDRISKNYYEKPSAPKILSAKRIEDPKLDREIVFKIVEKAAEKYGIDSKLSKAIIGVESSYNQNAISSDGYNTKGLFQLKDSTGKEILEKHMPNDEYNPFNSKQNVQIGTIHLSELMNIFEKPTILKNGLKTIAIDDLEERKKFAAASFNAGQGRVAYAQKQAKEFGKDPTRFANIEFFLPTITQRYIKKIFD